MMAREGFMALLDNHVLIAATIAWALAQIIKVPVEYLRTRRWNWVLLFQAGGMPSSHSALVSGVAHGIGLHFGFDTPSFAIAAAIAAVVIYDATGIRRQAGKHAAFINTIIQDLAAGHPLQGEQLLEVLGHTPVEAIAGMVLGLGIAQLEWMLVG
jgi:acid phosphatase family membrane protein YuiD